MVNILIKNVWIWVTCECFYSTYMKYNEMISWRDERCDHFVHRDDDYLLLLVAVLGSVVDPSQVVSQSGSERDSISSPAFVLSAIKSLWLIIVVFACDYQCSPSSWHHSPHTCHIISFFFLLIWLEPCKASSPMGLNSIFLSWWGCIHGYSHDAISSVSFHCDRFYND